MAYANYGLLTKNKRTSLPLKDVSVEAEIQGYVMGLKSTLKYDNDSSDPVEVMFRFPLEQSHAVVRLTAIIDGRKIKAKIREKEEARADYDDALASGQSAALAEEKSGDVFSISLGNLPPGKEAEIHLQLVGELGIDAEGSVRFSLPSTLKPRYTPAGSTDPLARVEGGAQDQVEQASTSSVQKFHLTVLNAKSVAEVTSPMNTLTTALDDALNCMNVTLAGSLSGDLVILLKYKDSHTPKGAVEAGSPENENAFMSSPTAMIDFFPQFDDSTDMYAASEFIFLVDRSGSMRGGFINSARETLILFLKSLPEECNFNIIGFGSSYEKLFPAVSVPYSQETLDKATRHAQGMQADLGGTELLRPLELVLKEKTTSRLPRQVFVLTDGAVSNTDACIKKVQENVKYSRCFTFGIGSGASTALVEGLARAGNGTAEFVKEGERLQPKVIRSLKRALQPAVTDVSVEFKVPGDFVLQQSPQTLPPVYNGEKMVIYGVLTPKGSPQDKEITGKAILKGQILGKKVEHCVPFTFNPVATSHPSLSTIHHLAAKALIKDWQDQGKSKEEVVKLSVDSSVISSHTAFIAIDEENSEPVSGTMKTWDVQPRFHYASMVGGGYRGGGAGVNRCYQSSPVNRKRGAKMKSAPMKKCAKKKSAVRSSGRSPMFTKRLEREHDLTLESRSRSRSRSRSPVDISRLSMAADDDLNKIIAAQQANGSWDLRAVLACIRDKSETDIKDASPVECKGNVAAIWATVLMLTLLKKKYSSQQDEWELIAMKAESWVKKQPLPSGVTAKDLYTAAEQLSI